MSLGLAAVAAGALGTGCGDDDGDEKSPGLDMPAAIPAEFLADGGAAGEAPTKLEALLASVVDGSKAKLGLGSATTTAGLSLQGYVGSTGIAFPDADELVAGADCSRFLMTVDASLAQMRYALTQARAAAEPPTTAGGAAPAAPAAPWYTKTALPPDPRFSVHDLYTRREPTAEEAAGAGSLISMLPTTLTIGLGTTATQAAVEIKASIDVDLAKLRQASGGATSGGEGDFQMSRMLTDSTIDTFVDADAKLARTTYGVEASVETSRGLMTTQSVGSTELTGGDAPKLVATASAVMSGNGQTVTMSSSLTLEANADGTVTAMIDADVAGQHQAATKTLAIANGKCAVK